MPTLKEVWKWPLRKVTSPLLAPLEPQKVPPSMSVLVHMTSCLSHPRSLSYSFLLTNEAFLPAGTLEGAYELLVIGKVIVGPRYCPHPSVPKGGR